MTIAFSNEYSAGISSSVSYNVTGVTAASNTTMVAVVHIKAGSSITVSSITDSAGNTWAHQTTGYQSGANTHVEIWTATATTGLSGGSVTITHASAASGRCSLSVWSGVSNPIIVDAMYSLGSAATTTPASVTVATTDPGSVVIGGISYPDVGAPASGPGAGWTTLSGSSPASTFYGTAAYALPGTTGTYGPTWTLPVSVASGAAIIALLPPSSGVHAPRLQSWRWYTDGADASMASLAGQNTTPTLSTLQIQNATLRLRAQIREINGIAGSGTIGLEYNGESGVWRALEAQTPTANQEGVWFRWANGAATNNTGLSSTKLTGTTTSGVYHEADGLSESVGASAYHEIDIALKVHWPPPDTSVQFRLTYGGSPLNLASGASTITLTTTPASGRPYTVTRLDGDAGSKTSRETRYTPWERMVYDPYEKAWWLFLVQYNTSTVIRSFKWLRAGDWTPGPTLTVASASYRDQNTYAFVDTGSSIRVYCHCGSSSTSRIVVSGTISSGSLTWDSPVTVTQNSDREHTIAVDDGGYLWIAGINVGTGVWVRRSVNAEDVSSWQAGTTIADTSTVSGDVVALVGLASDRVLVIWRPNSAVTTGVPMRYAVVNSSGTQSSGTLSTTADTSDQDWGLTRSGGYVYVIHSDSGGAGGNWVLRVFNESNETWATGPSPGVSGQPSTHDGIAVSASTGAIHAFGTFAGVEGGQDRILKYKTYTGSGTSGSWGSLATLSAGGRLNGDHLTVPRMAGDGMIPLLFEFGDDDITGNARGLECWPLVLNRTISTTPLRGTFYYPWFTGGSDPSYPGAWNQGGVKPFTQFHPVRGYYDCASTIIIDQHIGDMVYGKFDVAIASWWGAGSREDTVIPTLMHRSLGTNLRWCLYYEMEGNATATPGSPDPSAATIAADLNYILSRYTNHPGYLFVNGKPVIFVYGDPGDGGASQVSGGTLPNQRWGSAVSQAFQNFYVVLKVWSGYSSVNPQPDSWHQYGPASAVDSQSGYSYTISPGYWKATDTTPLLSRLSEATWRTNIRNMLAANVSWKLVTSYNEWGEGHSIEAADGPSGRDYTGTGWASPTGYGKYLDGLAMDGEPLSNVRLGGSWSSRHWYVRNNGAWEERKPRKRQGGTWV